MNNVDYETGEIIEEKTVTQKMIDAFVDTSGIPLPYGDKDITEKWLHPFQAIADKTPKDDDDMMYRAIREAVKECRSRDILVSSPKSIMSTALHLISQWERNQTAVNVTQAEFEAYRNKLISLGYNVKW